MLRELKVENYAIIEHLDIEFHSGLNIITGETGAGKSILLGALALLGGARADSNVIRDQATNCVIEATFDIAGYGLEELFAASDLDYSPTVTIRRVLSPAGKSRAYIDDLPVNLSTMKEIAEQLVDIHSQHQTLLLAGSGFQTHIVDAVAGHSSLLENYAAAYKQLNDLRRQLSRTQAAAAEALKERDYLQYQFDQLTDLRLREGEAKELETQQNLLTHAEEIAQSLDLCAQIMTDDEQGVNAAVKNMVAVLHRTAAQYPEAEELAARMESVFLEMKDLADECSRRRDRIEIDPARLAQINERLDTIYSLCQKHGVSDPDELIRILTRIDEQLRSISRNDEEITRLQQQITQTEASVLEQADRITAGRKAVLSKIEGHVLGNLAELGIPNARFDVQMEPLGQPGPSGADRITMLFSGNAGSAPQPIEQVASGGEISRVMLSLKGLVAQSIQLPTIIFDEIDTGVSGKIADKMGEIIVRMSRTMQVLNITHLPQVASKGAHHYHVYKENGTHIRKLTDAERVEQIATMLSGSNITEAARTQAHELLKTV